MGEIADQMIEEGFDDWMDHVEGRCGYDSPCQYCEEADVQKKRQSRKNPKKANKKKRSK